MAAAANVPGRIAGRPTAVHRPPNGRDMSPQLVPHLPMESKGVLQMVWWDSPLGEHTAEY